MAINVLTSFNAMSIRGIGTMCNRFFPASQAMLPPSTTRQNAAWKESHWGLDC